MVVVASFCPADLQELVENVYTTELVARVRNTKNGNGALHHHENNKNGATTSSSAPTSSARVVVGQQKRMQLLESWKRLVHVIVQLKRKDDDDTVYMDNMRNLRQAFLDIFNNNDDNGGGVDDVSHDNNHHHHHHHHLNTVVNLMTHTAQHRDVDPSTDCRFVTLLEIALSYGPNWQVPSAEVTRLWSRLMPRLPADYLNGPVAFRRQAYRILVSLSWVPITKGLMEACSFEITNSKPQQRSDDNNSIIAPPVGVREQLARIRNGAPLQRHDGVNQLLDRLKDETDVCVALTSEKAGAGKTTLAALVASHPSILRVFKVLWLRLSLKDNSSSSLHNDHDDEFIDGASSCCHSTASTASILVDDDSKELTYERYIKNLDNLCQQAGLAAVDWPTCEKRFEEPALRRLRHRQFMEAARSQMADLLHDVCACDNRSVLLVLDNVTDSEQIQWFRFNELQSMIVTTTEFNKKFDGVDWNVPLEPVMMADEAIDLFLLEANLTTASQQQLAAMVEIQDVVQKCEYQPLTIRTVARWYQMRKVTAGHIGALQEILEELNILSSSSSSSSSSPPPEGKGSDSDSDGELTCNDDDEEDDDDEDEAPFLLFDVLILMMGPDRLDDQGGTSVLFVLCFAAMVVIFPQRRVPLDVVIILWEQIMRVSPLAIDELNENPSLDPRKHAWFIAEGLIHMGVVTVTADKNGIGHRGPRWIEVHHSLYADFAMAMARKLDLEDTFEKTRESWHKAFVTAYFEQRIQNVDASHDTSDDNSWEYAVEKLPAHIFQANMLPLAETILADASFFRTRVETMGWDRAIELHVQDCVQLQHCIEADMQSSQDILAVSAVFAKTAAIVREYAQEGDSIVANNNANPKQIDQVASALYKIGFAMAEQGYFEEAMIQFEAAQEFHPQSQGPRCNILYAISWVYLASGEGELALKTIENCRNLLGETTIRHDLYKEMMQLHADGLVEACDYIDASKMLNDIEQGLLSESDANKIELGTVYFRKGRIYHAMGELENARAAFKESLKWKQDVGECSHSLAVVFSNLADVEMELRSPAMARAHYDCALRTLEMLDCDPAHISYLLMSGKAFLLKKDYDGGFASLEDAIASIEVAPLLLMDQSAYDLRCVAMAYRNHDNLDRAIDVLNRSLLLTAYREFSIERAWGLLELGRCLLTKDKLNQGLEYVEESLKIQVNKLGECVIVMNTLKTVGEVHSSLGDLDNALKAFNEILEMATRIRPDDVERIAGITFAIGQVYEAKKDALCAMDFYMSSAELLKDNGRSPNHVDISRAMQQMGNIQAASLNMGKALEYYIEALRIRRLHSQEQLEAETCYSIGVIHRKLGDDQAAQQSFKDALTLRNKVHDVCSAGTILLEIGNIYRVLGDIESALPLYTRALKDLVGYDGNSDVLLGNLHLAIGHSKLALGERGDALESYQQARNVRVKVFGVENMRTANTARSLGLVNFLLGRQDRAMLDLTEYVRTCELNSEDDEQEARIVGPSPRSCFEDDKKDADSDQLAANRAEKPDHTQTLDFALAVIMLGDLHCSKENTKQAVRGWSLANKICAKRNNFEDRVPQLASMIYRRLEEEEACISGGKVMLNDEEAEILQQVAFVDD